MISYSQCAAARNCCKLAATVCRTDSLESCIDDCKANEECGCAFWRPHDRKPISYCALTTAECSDPTIGAQIDYTRIRTAIVKCGYSASAPVQEGWSDETYDGAQLSLLQL